ncbi:40825_t:CDS:2, partial [Gigaspora margarita]
SGSSNSEGITKIFQNAQNYQQTSSKENPVIVVVLFPYLYQDESKHRYGKKPVTTLNHSRSE